MNVSPEAIYFFKNRFYCRKVAALFSAPLSRLTPIEALPQAPQGLCPLTPQAL